MTTPTFSPLAKAIKAGMPASLLLMAAPAFAQQVEQQQDQLETLVVTASALKVNTPMAETPMSVSVVSEEDLEFRNVGKLDESFRYSAGVLSAPYGADNDTDWIRVRGFEAATYLDGNRLFKDGYYTWMLEPYGLEQVELLKGPASILYGEAPPGGVVNAVQKKPTYEPQGEVVMALGDDNHKQFGFDASGPANEQGDIRYRVVGMFLDEEGELNGSENQRFYIAPSLAIDLSDRTSLTLNATVMKDDGVPTNGFFPAEGTQYDSGGGKIDPSTNFGEPDYDNYERTQISAGYQLDHQLNANWALTQKFNYGYNDLNLRSVYIFPTAHWQDPTGETYGRGAVYRDGDVQSITLDNRAVGNWYGDRTEQTLLLGVDLQTHKNEGEEQDNYGFDVIDPFNFEHGNYTPLDMANNISREINKDQASIYGQYQLKLDEQWVGIVGARYDYVDTENTNHSSGVTEDRSDDQVSLNAGLMYLSEFGLSPYISYAESFEVISTVDPATNSLYQPLEGKQTEIGLKYEPEFIDGFINLAWFDIEQKNALVTNPDTWVQTQTGEVTSQGVELEGQGYLTESLKLSASYTYTDAKTDETYGQGKKRAGMIPRHQANLWGDYDFSQLGLAGLKLGTGVRYIGSSVDNPASSDRKVGATTLVDMAISYEISSNWQAQVNVNNLFDEEYISACDYYCYYGESRSFTASIKYRW